MCEKVRCAKRCNIHLNFSTRKEIYTEILVLNLEKRGRARREILVLNLEKAYPTLSGEPMRAPDVESKIQTFPTPSNPDPATIFAPSGDQTKPLTRESQLRVDWHTKLPVDPSLLKICTLKRPLR